MQVDRRTALVREHNAQVEEHIARMDGRTALVGGRIVQAVVHTAQAERSTLVWVVALEPDRLA